MGLGLYVCAGFHPAERTGQSLGGTGSHVDGDVAINSIRQHRGHDPVCVSPLWEANRGASATFLPPSTGPSATLPGGGVTVTVQTDEQGRARARGLHPNAIEGRSRFCCPPRRAHGSRVPARPVMAGNSA